LQGIRVVRNRVLELRIAVPHRILTYDLLIKIDLHSLVFKGVFLLAVYHLCTPRRFSLAYGRTVNHASKRAGNRPQASLEGESRFSPATCEIKRGARRSQRHPDPAVHEPRLTDRIDARASDQIRLVEHILDGKIDIDVRCCVPAC